MREENIMKKGNVFVKKSLSVMLASVLAVSSLAGCGKQQGKNENSMINEAAKASKDYVFMPEIMNLNFRQGTNLSRLKIVGDRIFATSNDEDQKFSVYSFNSDGSDVKSYSIPIPGSEGFSYMDFDADENLYALYYKYNYYYGDDEEIHLMEEDEASEGESSEGEASEEPAAESSENNETIADTDPQENRMMADDTDVEDEEYFIVKYDNTGKLLYKNKINQYLKDEDNSLMSVTGLVYSENYGLLLSGPNQIFSYDENSGLKPLLKSSENGDRDYTYYYLHRGFQDKIFVTYYSDGGQMLCSFDPATGTIGEPSSSLGKSYDYSFFGGNGYDFYYCDDTAAYGYDQSKDEMVKLMDYVDSDLETTSVIYSIVALSDKEFIALIPDYDYNYNLTRLTKVPPEQVVDKIIITMAGSGIPYDIRRKALNFNKNNGKYKIKMVDYSSLDDESNWNAGVEQLNLDIISGNTPDILVLGDSLPVGSYINKGLFLDLSPLLEKDPDMSESDFLTNVIDACKTNGKLYQIVPEFAVNSICAKERYIDDPNNFTFKVCNDLVKKINPKKDFIFGMTTRSEFMENGLKFSGDKYIDWENKTCSFNNDSFIEFLELANKMAVEFGDGVWEDYKDSIYRDDEALFSIQLFSSFRDFIYMKNVLFGEEVSFVGFPNDMGENFSTIQPEISLAICSQASDKDGAWSFVREFLTQEYQDNISYNFPIRKTSFDTYAAKAMEKPSYMENGKLVEYDYVYYIDGNEVTAQPLTKEEVTKYSNFIKGIHDIASSNRSVTEIINEEASAFFSGQKSAKEVADIIQSRLSIYVNENS
jgi:ABC-type glycerol-3-phosphate transport system substrate-binding protein